jgi:hypothetical protein
MIEQAASLFDGVEHALEARSHSSQYFGTVEPTEEDLLSATLTSPTTVTRGQVV